MFNYCDKDMDFFFFFDKQGYPNLFESDYSLEHVQSPHLTHQVITGRNSMRVAPRCWQEVLNPRSHEYHDASETTKPIL